MRVSFYVTIHGEKTVLCLLSKQLTFPISEFGLCSCGFLVHPL